MAYQVVVNSPVSILHPVKNLLDTATVTGQAGVITKALLDEGMAASALPVTITEIGTSGYYTAQFTPDAVGSWVLTLTNPPGTDAGVYVYTVSALTQAEIAAATARDLTSLARVRERMYMPDTRTALDGVIASLITEESNGIQDRLGRVIGQFSYPAEYLNGRNGNRLPLKQGPVVQINSVNCVQYVDAGAGARGEELTLLDEYQYVIHGQRAENGMLRGVLERVDGAVFDQGARNWKIDYIAGFNPIPEGLVGWVNSLVVNRFYTREAPLMSSKDVGEATVSLLSPRQLAREEERILSPYRDPGSVW